MKQIVFDEQWFEEQFGPRPKRNLWEICSEIYDTEIKLSDLELELSKLEIYLARRDAALKTVVNAGYQLGEFKWERSAK